MDAGLGMRVFAAHEAVGALPGRVTWLGSGRWRGAAKALQGGCAKTKVSVTTTRRVGFAKGECYRPSCPTPERCIWVSFGRKCIHCKKKKNKRIPPWRFKRAFFEQRSSLSWAEFLELGRLNLGTHGP